MNFNELYEDIRRGTFDFPVQLYLVDRDFPRFEMSFHWHLEFEMVRVLRGGFELSLDGTLCSLQEGDCAWIGGGVVHGGTPQDDETVYQCIVFDLHALLDDPAVCVRSMDAFFSQGKGHTAVLRKGSRQAELMEEIIAVLEQQEAGYDMITVGLIWQLMGSLLSVPADHESSFKNKQWMVRLKNVFTYMKDHYDRSIRLDDLAEIAGMTPKYFCRAFASVTGKTPISYLNYYRIEQAGEKLQTTYDSITDIAISCGFNDMSYFSKAFARQKGMSPSAYRKVEPHPSYAKK